MSITDGLIEDELHKMVASGEDEATARADGEVIEEATRRARARAGLMITNPPGAEAMDHWETVLSEFRDEAEKREDEQSPVADECARPIS